MAVPVRKYGLLVVPLVTVVFVVVSLYVRPPAGAGTTALAVPRDWKSDGVRLTGVGRPPTTDDGNENESEETSVGDEDLEENYFGGSQDESVGDGDPLAGNGKSDQAYDEESGAYSSDFPVSAPDEVGGGGGGGGGTESAPDPGSAAATPPASLLPGVNETVDIVYLWVNGSDPAWYGRRNASIQAARAGGIKLAGDGISAKRFYDNEELKFSIRSG